MKDLIDESSEDLTVYGYETTNLKKFGITCSKLFIETNAKAKKLGFDKGHYFILNTPLLSEFLEGHRVLLLKEIFARIDFLFKENKIKKVAKFCLLELEIRRYLLTVLVLRPWKKSKLSLSRKVTKFSKSCQTLFQTLASMRLKSSR